jgi:hypothetical protein
MNERFTVHPVAGECYQVFDGLLDKEVCICNAYEDESHHPDERAQTIAGLLNASSEYFMKPT